NPPVDPETAQSKLTCYGCGTPGVTNPKYPICSPTKNRSEFSTLSVFKSSTLIAFLPIRINKVNGIGCADSEAIHSIAGEGLNKILQKQGMKFIKESFSMTFADGHSSNSQVLTTQVIVKIKNRVVRTKFITLPESKGNIILLSLDFFTIQASFLIIRTANGTFF
ncbi:hypothetical protein AVEN_130481-2-1, partial [Araneus ventricosus]